MALTHTIDVYYKDAGETIPVSISHSSEGAHNIDVVIPGETTDKQVDFAIDKDRMVSLLMVADGDLVIETNTTPTGVDSISLVANVPFLWTSDYLATPFSADVTTLYVTNAAASDVTLRIRALQDSTP